MDFAIREVYSGMESLKRESLPWLLMKKSGFDVASKLESFLWFRIGRANLS